MWADCSPKVSKDPNKRKLHSSSSRACPCSSPKRRPPCQKSTQDLRQKPTEVWICLNITDQSVNFFIRIKLKGANRVPGYSISQSLKAAILTLCSDYWLYKKKSFTNKCYNIIYWIKNKSIFTSTEQQEEKNWISFQCVLMGALDAIEDVVAVVLIAVDQRVLHVVLLAGAAHIYAFPNDQKGWFKKKKMKSPLKLKQQH